MNSQTRCNKHEYCHKCRKVVRKLQSGKWNGLNWGSKIWCNSCYNKEMDWRSKVSMQGGYIPA